VTGTNASGCINSAGVVSLVTVIASPTLAVNSGSICSGRSFTLTPNGAATYTYSSGFNVVSPTSTTNYTVTGTNASGCVNSTGVVSSVTVIASPTLSVNSGLICLGGSFSITPSGAATYTYSSGSNVVSPTTTTGYTITGTNAIGCANTIGVVSTVTVSLCTGLGESTNLEVSIYPNPAKDLIYVTLPVGDYNKTTIELYDATGKLILTENMVSKTTSVSLNNLSIGIYTIRVISNKVYTVTRIIKE
jgi:hypothetical protein